MSQQCCVLRLVVLENSFHSVPQFSTPYLSNVDLEREETVANSLNIHQL